MLGFGVKGQPGSFSFARAACTLWLLLLAPGGVGPRLMAQGLKFPFYIKNENTHPINVLIEEVHFGQPGNKYPLHVDAKGITGWTQHFEFSQGKNKCYVWRLKVDGQFPEKWCLVNDMVGALAEKEKPLGPSLADPWTFIVTDPQRIVLQPANGASGEPKKAGSADKIHGPDHR